MQPNTSSLLNTIEVYWDAMKEVGVYIKVNCISTEFTPKKHGGEKGVPFRIQVETFLDSSLNDGGGNGSNGMDNTVRPLHAAACQIKVNSISMMRDALGLWLKSLKFFVAYTTV